MTVLKYLALALLSTSQSAFGAPLQYARIAPAKGSDSLSHAEPWQEAGPASAPHALHLSRRSEREEYVGDVLGPPPALRQDQIWASTSGSGRTRVVRRDGSSSSESSSESDSSSGSDSEDDAYHSDASQTQAGASKVPKNVQFAEGTKKKDATRSRTKSKGNKAGNKASNSFVNWMTASAGPPQRKKKSSSGSSDSERQKTRHSRKESDHVDALNYAQRKAEQHANEVARYNAGAKAQVPAQTQTPAQAQAMADQQAGGAGGAEEQSTSKTQKSTKGKETSIKPKGKKPSPLLTYLAGGRP